MSHSRPKAADTDSRTSSDTSVAKALLARLSGRATVDEVLELLSALRRRPVVVEQLTTPTPTSLCGLTVATADRDYIAIAGDAPLLHRTHTTLHEVAHLALGHDGMLSVESGTRGHAAYEDGAEHAAEMLATTLGLRVTGRASTGRFNPPHSIRTAAAWWQLYALYRGLGPLWSALAQVEPAIVLDPPPTRPLNVPLDARRALYRRVIEIHDGIRLLRPYLDPLRLAGVRRAARAEGLSAEASEITALAAALDAALTQRRRGVAPSGGSELQLPDCIAGVDLLSEAQAMHRLASAFTRWPLLIDELAQPSQRRRRRPRRRLGRQWTTDVHPAVDEAPSGSGGGTSGWLGEVARRPRDVVTDRYASAARMTDYYLGGTYNFRIDREAAEQIIAANPLVPAISRANRAWLTRVVRYLVGQGIRQFLVMGSGIPTMGNAHEVAQAIAADATVLYVDEDPIAVMHSLLLLDRNSLATAITGDLHRPDELLRRLASPELAPVLDLTRPVALILTAILNFVPDDAQAYAAVAAMREALSAGSYLAVSHATPEAGFDDAGVQVGVEVYQQAAATSLRLRTAEKITKFFDELDVVDPGLVWIPQWRPDRLAPDAFVDDPQRCGVFGGVGRVSMTPRRP